MEFQSSKIFKKSWNFIINKVFLYNKFFVKQHKDMYYLNLASIHALIGKKVSLHKIYEENF